MIEPCSCPVAGFCQRHNRKKTDHLHKLCKTREDYRDKWDKESGYKQEKLPQDPISIAARFAEEYAKWLASGFKTRPLEVIQKTFDETCSKCPFFVEQEKNSGSCDICGCAIAREDQNINKLAWATTRCPLKEPKWVEYDETKKAEPKGLFSGSTDSQGTVSVEQPKSGCGCSKKS